MASYDLIDDYLQSLQRHMRWRSDAGDIDFELRDHLYTAVEAATRRGIDSEAAQRDVLRRFGDATDVSLSFVTTGSRGVALPTQFTTTAGLVGTIAAAGWLGVVIAWTVAMLLEQATGGWEAASTIAFMLGTALLLGSAGLTVVVAVALDRRHGGLGRVGQAGIAICGLGVVACVISWFLVGWSVLIGLGALSISTAIYRRGIAPAWPTVIFGGGFAVALALFGILRYLEVGDPDEWGDYPVADRTLLYAGCLTFALGIFGLSRWLRNETPVDPRAVGVPSPA